MNNPFVRFPALCLFSSLAVALASAPVAASTPDQLADLLYQDYGWDSDQLHLRRLVPNTYRRRLVCGQHGFGGGSRSGLRTLNPAASRRKAYQRSSLR